MAWSFDLKDEPMYAARIPKVGFALGMLIFGAMPGRTQFDSTPMAAASLSADVSASAEARPPATKRQDVHELLSTLDKEWRDGNISKVLILHVHSHCTYRLEYSPQRLESDPEFALVVFGARGQYITRSLVAEIGKLKARDTEYQNDALRWGFIFANEKQERVVALYLDEVSRKGVINGMHVDLDSNSLFDWAESTFKGVFERP